MITDTKELAILKGQVTKLETQAHAITIESPEEYASAADLVAKLKETGSTIKKKKESITKPLNEALRNVRELFSPIDTAFSHAEAVIKGKILAYKQKKDAEAAKEEASIAARAEKGTIKLETAERKMGEIERVDTTTRGKVGEVQIHKLRKVRITNESAIPRQYLVPDMVLIRKDALGGIAIDGVEVYEEETVAAGIY